MAELLRPTRGGFLGPFGCGAFIHGFLLGNGPHGSPMIDINVGAPQADIFYHYKMALMKATALDRATRVEERRSRQEKRPINPDNIESLAGRYMARILYKSTACQVSDTRTPCPFRTDLTLCISPDTSTLIQRQFDMVHGTSTGQFRIRFSGVNRSSVNTYINTKKYLRGEQL